MTHPLQRQPLTLAAIDLETAPDAEAQALATRHRGPVGRNVALHRIRGAGWIVMKEDVGGHWHVAEIGSQDDAEAEEFDILLSLNGILADLVDCDGEMVTYNGMRHDGIVLRRRASRHWMFDLGGLFPTAPIRHRDVMRLAGQNLGDWPKLREACAGLGFSCDHDFDYRGTGHLLSPRRRKAETDAIATMIIRLHELAAERQDVRVLARSWNALARYIEGGVPSHPHRLQFTTSLDLTAARNRGMAA